MRFPSNPYQPTIFYNLQQSTLIEDAYRKAQEFINAAGKLTLDESTTLPIAERYYFLYNEALQLYIHIIPDQFRRAGINHHLGFVQTEYIVPLLLKNNYLIICWSKMLSAITHYKHAITHYKWDINNAQKIQPCSPEIKNKIMASENLFKGVLRDKATTQVQLLSLLAWRLLPETDINNEKLEEYYLYAVRNHQEATEYFEIEKHPENQEQLQKSMEKIKDIHTRRNDHFSSCSM